MTVNVNLAGLPAVVLPAAYTTPEAEGGRTLPIGIQLIGRAFDEARLLGLAHAFERTAELPAKRAPLATAGGKA
jgi:aspartyl-tRNA(Asn)/glutamyl-tRNA(Gln) amidotransferase subunit A